MTTEPAQGSDSLTRPVDDAGSTSDARLEGRRILTLDDGGIRNVISLRVLHRIEDTIHRRGEHEDVRLGDWFDLIVGAGSGAVVASLLSLGWRVQEIDELVDDLGPDVFMRPGVGVWARSGFGTRYRSEALDRLLESTFTADGSPITLGSDRFLAHLLVPIHDAQRRQSVAFTTIPTAEQNQGPYSHARTPLWHVLRASATTPTYFGTHPIDLPGDRTVVGTGAGVTPYKNPTLLALIAATSHSYGLDWSATADDLLVAAVGAGLAPSVAPSRPHLSAVRLATWTPRTIADSTQRFQDQLAQYLGRPRHVPADDPFAGEVTGGRSDTMELFSYVRYDTVLDRAGLDHLAALHRDLRRIRWVPATRVRRPDQLRHLEALRLIGAALAEEVVPGHFDGF